MNNGAAISTEAETLTASGGNITLRARDFLHLVSSEITASVKGETGNGGNIVIEPVLVVLNHSSIIASAIEGRGGNIVINGEIAVSTDSVVSARGKPALSGTLVDVNDALVLLSSELRSATEVLRDSCVA
jgi:large exoprotein involved in heme utilization and adhesion